MFNVSKIPYQNIIYDGNSLFSRGNGNVASVYEAPIACQTSITVRKPPCFFVAISGRTIASLISEFSTKVAPLIQSGTIVVMNEGTNSLNNLQNPTLVYNDLISYRDLVVAAGGRLIVSTITARGTATAYASFDTDRLTYNANLLSNSNQFLAVVDAASNVNFATVGVTSNATYYNADTLHFATAGYSLYGQLFQAVLQPFLKY
jgi:hypothetical protein